jgi:hypothetical protein
LNYQNKPTVSFSTPLHGQPEKKTHETKLTGTLGLIYGSAMDLLEQINDVTYGANQRSTATRRTTNNKH